MSGVMAATLLRTVSLEVCSNSRLLAIDALLASRAWETAESWDPERIAAMMRTSEAFSRAKENQSFCSGVNFFSEARVTGV